MGTEKRKNIEYKKLSELAQHFSYNREYLSKLAREKKIPAKNIGGIWFSTYEGILKYSKIASGQNKTNELAETFLDSDLTGEWITMAQASKLIPYSQEYLSLRARQGKLPAEKIAGEWYTTAEVAENYHRLMVSENPRDNEHNETLDGLSEFIAELVSLRPRDLKKINTVNAVLTFGYLLGQGYLDAYKKIEHPLGKKISRLRRIQKEGQSLLRALREKLAASANDALQVYGEGMDKAIDAVLFAKVKTKIFLAWLDRGPIYKIKDLIPPREIGMYRMEGFIPPISISPKARYKIGFAKALKASFRTSENATKYAFGFALAVVLLLSSGSFLVWAINNDTQTLEVFPQKYELSSSEGVSDWYAPQNILERELEQTAQLSDFNSGNSASTVENTPEEELTYLYTQELQTPTKKDKAGFWDRFVASLGFSANAVGEEEELVLPNLEGEGDNNKDSSNADSQGTNYTVEADEDLSIFLYKKSIELSDFGVADILKQNSEKTFFEIYEANLMLSLAASGEPGSSQLLFEWSLDGDDWYTATSFNQDKIYTNNLNGGYYKFPLNE
ncbi:MAG: hypothetical protein Q8P37_00745, partial [Candidatus Spechtbacteria bacterium]|nr:hypothetical protein [Candidatus Spechtbacteria bacterium]